MDPQGTQSIIFQVTLPSGMVATNPGELALARLMEDTSSRPVVAADGKVLSPAQPPPAAENDKASA